MKTFLLLLLTALVTATATWFAARSFDSNPNDQSPAGERKPLFYQSAMHPWIKSDKPGRCTICGMELTPVYEGEQALDASAGGDLVTLTQNQIQVLHVQTAEAKNLPLVRTLRVAGTIDDDNSRHRILSAYTDGRIDKLHVNYIGAEVTAGQPLADFYSPTLLQAEREYRQLTGDLRRNAALRLRQLGLTEEQIDALPDKPQDSLTSHLLSPISGTVVEQAVYAGQYVTTGQRLFEIADFSTMWFMFRAYEQDMPWLKPGLTVRITTPSLPGKTFTGSITFIDPNFDPATRSTNIRVELPNPMVDGRRELLNRLYAEGEVALTTPTALTIPRSAVIETGAEAVVYVAQEGGAYRRTTVQLGMRGDDLVQVLDGVKAGDPVVTNGNLLIDGQAEMNRTFMSPADPPEEKSDPRKNDTTLTADQVAAIEAFIKVADQMAAALAADDVPAFNKASEPAMDATGTLLEQLRPKLVDPDALDQARHFHGFDDIAKARKAFHTFSTAATTALEPLRRAKRLPGLKLYECGMVDQAIPGVPKKGRWIQRNDRAMTNPFFGKEMLECGSEVQP